MTSAANSEYVSPVSSARSDLSVPNATRGGHRQSEQCSKFYLLAYLPPCEHNDSEPRGQIFAISSCNSCGTDFGLTFITAKITATVRRTATSSFSRPGPHTGIQVLFAHNATTSLRWHTLCSLIRKTKGSMQNLYSKVKTLTRAHMHSFIETHTFTGVQTNSTFAQRSPMQNR